MERESHHAALLRALSVAALVGGCQGAFTTPPEPTETGEQPFCGNLGGLLAITDRPTQVGAGQLVVLSASGGTGYYEWSLAESDAGSEIDDGTGVYVAGDEPGTDLVLLEDRGCQGEASASIEIVPAPRVAPERVSVRPGETIAFERSGGSDDATFSVSGASGATIDPVTGVYVAGPRGGTDIVRLTDNGLGSAGGRPPVEPLFAEATVEVSATARLALTPSEWVVPLGSQVALPLEGGSGEYEVRVASGAAVEASADAEVVLRGIAAGRAEVEIEDRFTGRVVSASVRVVGAREAERRHHGDRSESHVVVSGTYDVDGDGHNDAIVGMPDASAGWFASGVVRIYRGNGEGLDLTPAREIAGAFRDEELGRAVAVADIDEDGLVDLLVGARRADALRTDVGALYVYSGVAGELFSEAPTRAWYGQASSDLFGSDVVVCDFNADGHLDVAVAAPFAQEADGETDQGVVHVFLYRADSARLFSSAPDVTLPGRALVGGAWTAVRSMLFGESIAAGDFDGDGACDLAASASGPSAEQLSSGVVALHRGRAGSGDDRGGLEPTPSLWWTRADGVDDNTRFGLRLAMGDVNGDGRADLLASRYLYDGAAGTDTGALYLLHGRALEGAATTVTDIATADWSYEGASAADRVGNAVAVIDVEGDGLADILSGDSRAGVMDSELSRPGIVRQWRGGALGAVPPREIEGTQSNARFGIGLGAIGDLDGDHTLELLAFAPYRDSAPELGDDRGALFLYRTLSAAPAELEMERPNSGQRAGRSVAWIGDLDGDGAPELAVGAPESDLAGTGLNIGAVRIHHGVEGAAAQTLQGFAGNSESDIFGYAVAPAGDFDGDGARDLAVVAQFGDLGTLSTETYEVGAGCTGRRSNAGAVFVFRGASDGTVASEPSFVIFGPEAGQLLDSVAGDVDVDGDGLDDLIIGGLRWDAGGNNAGGSMVVRGRAASDRIIAICTPDRLLIGAEENAFRGWAVTGLGDLDRPADGCDEYAVSAPTADPGGLSSAGEVHVVFPACGATPERIVRLFGADAGSQGGASLAGGVDGDGDGIPDLLIGAPRYRDGRGEVGRAHFVSGAYIASRTGSAPFANPASSARLVADGTSPGERLGESVAWAARGGGALAILGGPFGAAAGQVNTGGAAVYALDADGFAATPLLRVSGESEGQSQLGAAVGAVQRGDGVFIAVGAPYSSGEGWTDDGAAYAFTLP